MVKIIVSAGQSVLHSNRDRDDWFCHDKVVHAVIKKLKTYKGVEILRIDEPAKRPDKSSEISTDSTKKWQADVYVSITYSQSVQHDVNTFEVATPPKIIIGKGPKKPLDIHVLRETPNRIILVEDHRINSKTNMINFCNEKYWRAEGEAIADGLAISIDLEPFHEPTPEELVAATTVVLKYLESSRKGVIPKKWLKEIQEGTLTDSNAIALLYIVIYRWLID